MAGKLDYEEIKRLRKEGYGKMGPVKDSEASLKQSKIGNVPKEHIFCTDQRNGMLADDPDNKGYGWGSLLMGVGALALGATTAFACNELKKYAENQKQAKEDEKYMKK